MRIFVYEFVTGGGWYEVSAEPPSGSLLAEGRAMVSALVSDFAAVPDVTISCLQDERISTASLPSTVRVRSVHSAGDASLGFAGFVEEADFVLVIAPEIDGHLWRKTRIVAQHPRPLLSQPLNFVAECSNKWRAYHDFLVCRSTRGPTPTPKTVKVPRGAWPEHDLPYPLIAKPIDGCGSIGVQLLRSSTDIIDWSEFNGDAILQEYKPGVAASISILCGPTMFCLLPTCQQVLSKDGRFRYFGGECPLPDSWHDRAHSLALDLCGKDSIGWLGVDLILGAAEDGSQDYVIEINPRLTTSYVGLRALSNTNLAQAMLDVALGREPHLDWKPGKVTWSADGVVKYVGP